MFTENLYQEILLQPIQRGASEVYIVTGYASATFANRHLSENPNFILNLIIGMPRRRSDHLGYLNLIRNFEGRFHGYYLQDYPPSHCKSYSWYNENNPIVGYAGSTNYSQSGFFRQINQMSLERAIEGKELFNTLRDRSINMVDFAMSAS